MMYVDPDDGEIKERLIWIVNFVARTEFKSEIENKVKTLLNYFEDITFRAEKWKEEEDEITFFLKNTKKPGEVINADLS